MIQETAIVTDRGTLTLPASIRKALGLKGKQPMLVEMTDAGEIVLRPAYIAPVPIEYYTEARIAEFAQDDEALGKILNRLSKRRVGRKPQRKRRH